MFSSSSGLYCYAQHILLTQHFSLYDSYEFFLKRFPQSASFTPEKYFFLQIYKIVYIITVTILLLIKNITLT